MSAPKSMRVPIDPFPHAQSLRDDSCGYNRGRGPRRYCTFASILLGRGRFGARLRLSATGPRDIDGDPIGGRSLAEFALEARSD